MFTGIVTDLGRVRAVAVDGDTRIEITTTRDTAHIDLGASICCSGCCLTVVELSADWFAATVSAETLSRTTLGAWRPGVAVNLERSLKVGDELGGHFVSGHVDGVARVVSVTPEGGSRRLVLAAPEDLKAFIAAKGSVALDGVSLTVNHVDGACFGVNVIPHTSAVTTLGAISPGDAANLEIDLVARYVARLLAQG